MCVCPSVRLSVIVALAHFLSLFPLPPLPLFPRPKPSLSRSRARGRQADRLKALHGETSEKYKMSEEELKRAHEER